VTSVYQGIFSPRQEESPWVRGSMCRCELWEGKLGMFYTSNFGRVECNSKITKLMRFIISLSVVLIAFDATKIRRINLALNECLVHFFVVWQVVFEGGWYLSRVMLYTVYTFFIDLTGNIAKMQHRCSMLKTLFIIISSWTNTNHLRHVKEMHQKLM
jgi:hypothetical protein